MKKDVIPGNKFGGQLLIKISREKTNSPRPIEQKPILFNKTMDDAKSKLFADLNKAKQKEGKKLEN